MCHRASDRPAGRAAASPPDPDVRDKPRVYPHETQSLISWERHRRQRPVECGRLRPPADTGAPGPDATVHTRPVSERSTAARLITAAARRHLTPMGLRRKGRSRLWFDDRGWCLFTVEFQPGRGVGTYLNVAATWLWYDHDGAWTVDDGGRVWWRDDGAFTVEPGLGTVGWRQWAEFTREHIFAKEMELVAAVAARRVRQLRDQFPDPCATARYLAGRPARRDEDPVWLAYHTGAAYALCGDAEAARRAFARLGTDDRDLGWRHEVRQRATELSRIDSPTELRLRIGEIIETVRHKLGLGPWTPTVPGVGHAEDLDRTQTA